jgi:protein-S-isoprenylcysteine O-methyltransferase Ste14
MQPYFLTNHIAALLILVTIMAWGMMELSQISQEDRPRATRVGRPASRIAMLVCLAATVAVVNLVPHLVPAAAIRPGLVSFLIGFVLLLGGLMLRGWSIMTLGEYFTHNVMVSSDQRVVSSGPYHLLRHPSYAGVLLAAVGIGLTSANWVVVGGLLLLTLTPLLWRIHVEEKALLGTVGEPYRAYAAEHKRLVPLVW